MLLSYTSQIEFIGAMTAHKVVWRNLAQLGSFRSAFFDAKSATRMKVATGGRVSRIGNITL